MDEFDQQDDDLNNYDRIEIIDLDVEKSPRRKRGEQIIKDLYKRSTTPWIKNSIIGLLVLLLASALVWQFLWPKPSMPSQYKVGVDIAVVIIDTPGALVSTPPLSSTVLALQQRPLHVPKIAPGSACPTTPEKSMKTSNGPGATIVQGNGPVYVMTGSAVITSPAIMYYDDTQQFVSEKSMQGWSDAGVTWEVDPHYHGFVLVRGRQLDGPLALRFNQAEASPLAAQYVIDATAKSATWQSFFAYTRLQAPGCYAYQVDGDTFSYSIIFQAVVKN